MISGYVYAAWWWSSATGIFLQTSQECPIILLSYTTHAKVSLFSLSLYTHSSPVLKIDFCLISFVWLLCVSCVCPHTWRRKRDHRSSSCVCVCCACVCMYICTYSIYKPPTKKKKHQKTVYGSVKALGRSADVAAYLMAPNCLCIDPAATAASRSTSPIQTESHVSSGHQQRTSEGCYYGLRVWLEKHQQQHLTYLSMSWEGMRDVLCLLRPRHSWPLPCLYISTAIAGIVL